MKSRAEIIAHALKLIGVMAEDESPTAWQQQTAGDALDGLFLEIQPSPFAPWSPVSGVPDGAFLALSRLLAAEVAPLFGVAAPMSRAAAYIRVMAMIRPDDRPKEEEPSEDYGFWS